MSKPPLFSVVIPTCRRPQLLAQCLERLAPGKQSLAAENYEVIITDDGGTDENAKGVAGLSWVRWTQGPQRGPAANRNHGASLARGEWLAFIDDDCIPQPGWLDGFAAVAHNADVIEGRTSAPGAKDSPFEERVENEHGGMFWSCNLAVNRHVFDRLGGFDEDFSEACCEDMEFAWRIRHAGLRVCFASAAHVHHPPRYVGWRGVWRRTWMIRWMALYRLKTGTELSLATEGLNLLRTTARLVTRKESYGWRPRVFHAAWNWLFFPATFPWQFYWQSRFRRKLRERVTPP